MKVRIIHESKDGKYRIIEHEDQHMDLENLKGDCFNPKVNTDIPEEKLRAEELEFEELVNREGVFGYVLEAWNPEPGCGWEHVDSCWGFVGQYSSSETTFNHYIVDELKNQIPKESEL